MPTKGKFGLLIVLAFIMAGASVLMIHLLIRSEKNKAAQEARAAALEEFEKKKIELETEFGKNRVDVVVAATDISAASVIFPEMVKVKSVPQDIVPTGAFAKVDDVNEKVAMHHITTGDILLPSKIKPRTEITRPSFLVEKGKRYITLPFEPAVQGVAAMIRIGDIVDILATYGDCPKTAVSRIIVQKARVIDVAYGDVKTPGATNTPAKDQNSAGEMPEKRLGIGDTVTFEVTPEDSEMLKALEASGISYKYLLRNYQDNEIVQTPGKRTGDVISGLFGLKGEEAPAPEAAPPAPSVY